MATRLLGPADPDEQLLLERLITEREATERVAAMQEAEFVTDALGMSRSQGHRDGQIDALEELTEGVR